MKDENNLGYSSDVGNDEGRSWFFRVGIISIIFVVGIAVVFFISLSVSRWGGFDSGSEGVSGEGGGVVGTGGSGFEFVKVNESVANRQPEGEELWEQPSDCDSLEAEKMKLNCRILGASETGDVSLCETDLGEIKFSAPIESDELIEISANDFCWLRMTFGSSSEGNYCENVVHVESREVCLADV